jgi:hypothetical protein
MPQRRRLFIILLTGSFLIASEMAVFSAVKRAVGGNPHSHVTILESAEIILDRTSAASQLSQPLPGGHDFKWDWREKQKLERDQSLRNAELAGSERKAIASSISAQLRPNMADLEIGSDQQLWKAALDTRIKMIDLNGDGIPEVIAQGIVGCSATGNCPFWILQKAQGGYRLLLEGQAQTFTVQKTRTNGFLDIVLGRHASATDSILTDNRYMRGVYEGVACYDASWTVLENDKVRELQEPSITPCNHE